MLNIILGVIIAVVLIGLLFLFQTKSSNKKSLQGNTNHHNHKSGGHGCCH